MLTAVEDFVRDRGDLRLVVVPAFFGLGVVWHLRRPWSDALARMLGPWDRNPILERLEANRVYHVARSYSRQVELWDAEARQARQHAVLQRLLESSAFAIAEAALPAARACRDRELAVRGVQRRDPERADRLATSAAVAWPRRLPGGCGSGRARAR